MKGFLFCWVSVSVSVSMKLKSMDRVDSCSVSGRLVRSVGMILRKKLGLIIGG